MGETALIVDDDKEMLDILSRYLGNRGFAVICAKNGELGLRAAAAQKPDIVITDAEMPVMDGFALCKKMKDSRALDHIPVIMMSGKKISEADLVTGYGAGADDYVIKPFSYPVLLAKTHALLRRFKKGSLSENKVTKSGLAVNIESRAARLNGKALKLTSKEFDLLTLLMRKGRRVLTFSTLLEAVWGYDTASYSNPHTVKVHVSNLRKKLGAAGKHIVSVAGHGYKFE